MSNPAGRVVCQFAKFVATRGKHVLSRNYLRPIRLTPSLRQVCHFATGHGARALPRCSPALAASVRQPIAFGGPAADPRKRAAGHLGR
jgi:hypothetical protein